MHIFLLDYQEFEYFTKFVKKIQIEEIMNYESFFSGYFKNKHKNYGEY